MRTSKLKAGATREDIKDIETLEKAVWGVMDPERGHGITGSAGTSACFAVGDGFEEYRESELKTTKYPDGIERHQNEDGEWVPGSSIKGQGQNALFKNPNGQLPTGDPEIDNALGFGGDRE
jgi:hypothetical protein